MTDLRTEAKAELTDLKGAITQMEAGAKPLEEVQAKLMRAARWYIIGALLIGLAVGSLTGHYAFTGHHVL